MRKNGRPQKHYPGPDGKPVVGLSRMPDGRWRIIGTQIRFSEPDPLKAIEKFRRLTGEQTGAQKRMMERPNTLAPSLDEMIKIVCDEIRRRPQYVAQVGGIEQIAYLDQLKPPEKLSSLDELGDLYQNNAEVLNEEKRKVRDAWKDFRDTTGIQSLRDIDPDLAVAYREKVKARELKGKTMARMFNRVRRVLTFAREHNVSPAACRKALEALELLKAKKGPASLNPDPISPADWQKLYRAAAGDDKAMILLALNAACHLGEVCDLKWENIKGDCLVANRIKKGNHLRVAKLWPETLAALGQVKRRGDHIFYSETGLPLTASGAGKRFRKLREAAKVKVVADQLRDGAATAATEAKVEERFIRMLQGWRNPEVSDNYVKRNPSMVQPATDAIRAYYFGKESLQH